MGILFLAYPFFMKTESDRISMIDIFKFKIKRNSTYGK